MPVLRGEVLMNGTVISTGTFRMNGIHPSCIVGRVGLFDVSAGLPLHDVQHLLLDLFQFVLHFHHDVLHFRLV